MAAADRPSDDQPGLSYREAGVDIDAGDAVVRGIVEAARRTHDERVLSGLGHFGGFYQIGPTAPGATLVSSIDGVGTKLKIASLAGQHDGIGYDIVNHCINDILACGARPLFFLDYFATGKLSLDVAVTVIEGIAEACARADVALLGGETAEMPGVYHGEDYDVAGVIVGMVNQDSLVDGSTVAGDDVLIGLPSNGFHTNGYSLVRAALNLKDGESSRSQLREPLPYGSGQTLAQALLEPHRSYGPAVAAVLKTRQVTAMAHITGGGIAGNLSRVIPDGLQAQIDTDTWETPRLMTYVAEAGNISESECYRAFNMGIGYIIVARPDGVEPILDALPDAIVIGQVAAASDGERVVLNG